jgi:opacity protein-like surface antigen
MKTFAIALVAGVLATAPAMAQNAPRAAAPVATSGGNVYVGGSLGWGGAHLDDRAQWSNTLALGYELNKHLAVEATVDYNYKNSNANLDAGQTAFVNLVAGYPVGRITPYVLAGTGAGFNGSGDHHKNTEALWNVGGGVAYNVTRRWQIDARYRHIDAWQGNRHAEQAFSLGVNYRF